MSVHILYIVVLCVRKETIFIGRVSYRHPHHTSLVPHEDVNRNLNEKKKKVHCPKSEEEEFFRIFFSSSFKIYCI